MITHYLLIGLFSLSVFASILAIGEARKPRTVSDAAIMVAVYLALIIGLWFEI